MGLEYVVAALPFVWPLSIVALALLVWGAWVVDGVRGTAVFLVLLGVLLSTLPWDVS